MSLVDLAGATLAALLLAAAASAQAPGAPTVPLAHRERGSLVFDNIPAEDALLAARLARYRQSREATFLDWLPDGAMLIATRFGDSEQVHEVAAPLARARAAHLLRRSGE